MVGPPDEITGAKPESGHGAFSFLVVEPVAVLYDERPTPEWQGVRYPTKPHVVLRVEDGLRNAVEPFALQETD